MSTTVAPDVDLVNAALLGTDRRSLPVPAGGDPAGWLLDAAGRRRASTLVAGASTVVRVPEPGPEDGPPAPPAAAREVLDELLLQGSSVVLDLWLREALTAGSGLAPEHWTPVLDRARRSTDLDRRLGQALGPRGLWFARHNPAWSAVVRAAEAPGPAAPEPARGPDDLARLAQDPDLLLTWPDPWTADVGRVAVGVLAAGLVAVRAARAFGQRVGTRVPLETAAAVEAARPGLLDPVAGASARTGLAAAAEVLRVRTALALAFDPGQVPPPDPPDPTEPVPTTPQERP
ncbi:hypothetical protein GCM10022197_10630 [Microlunatus spumicola]|uniref:Uncharacterized protein n=1 Tax=Microlunatus spumicola TaxID=81499 RepID=A0ABP6WW30_9ACTN